jgi:hypothetical protein
MSEKEAIQDFLGERPGASELRDWLTTLEHRLAALEEERRIVRPEGVAGLEKKLTQLRKQVAALREEAAITEFVEDSVRATLAMGASTEGVGPRGGDERDDE